MSGEGHQWTVRLTATAEADFQNIIDWTLRQFGDRQARIYAETLAAALTALTEGPTAVGARERSEIRRRLFTLHVARGGRKGSHFVLFRVGPNERQHYVEVLRLLHDAMDLQLHNDLNAGPGIAVKEFQTDIGSADYALFVDKKAVGVIEAKPKDWGHKITMVEEQSSSYAAATLK